MLCAVPRTLPSTSTAAFVFGLLLVIGALLWVVGGRMSRSRVAPRALPPAPALAASWTRAILDSDEPLDVPARIDAIERLAMVGQPWCVESLNHALNEETDEDVRDAAERALIVIAARAN
jgi:hypothetical protein